MVETINALPLCQALYERNIFIISRSWLEEVADQMIIDEPPILVKTMMIRICR